MRIYALKKYLKLRLREMNPRKFTDEKKFKALTLYLAGETMKAIAAEVGTGVGTVRKYLNAVVDGVVNVKASRALANQHANPQTKAKLQNPELINEEFKELLSPFDSPELTPEEVKFCWSYVASNDYYEALSTAGLDVGLIQAKTGVDLAYKASCRLRIAYLRSKKNILRHIKELREDSTLAANIDKDFLQKEILVQLETLKTKDSEHSEKLARDYIQMLGRTFGGFTEKIEIGVVDHLKSVKALQEAAQSQSETLADLKKKKEVTLKEHPVVQ